MQCHRALYWPANPAQSRPNHVSQEVSSQCHACQPPPAVSSVSQELPELDELQAALQSSGNFCAFVRGMRAAFLAAVRREAQA